MMIDTISRRARPFTLNGKTYAKGDKVPMPLAQFNELGPDGLGWVERAPAPKPPETKPVSNTD